MILDYETLLCPEPIQLSIGTLKNPTLREIGKEVSFPKFSIYQGLLKINTELIYTKFKGEEGIKYWETLSEAQKNDIKLYDVIIADEQLRNTYLDIFDFFFFEKVIFIDDIFMLLNENVKPNEKIAEDCIKGIINRNTFDDILYILQQICCVNEKKIETLKFKNKLAEKLYKKMNSNNTAQSAKDKESLALGNVISAVSNHHPTVSPITVWDLTLFQLYNSFNRLQINEVYQMNKKKVSVWGDEKNKFDIAMWYKPLQN